MIRNLRHGLSGNSRVDDSFIEDIAQDAVIRILAKLDQFGGRSKFLTWATTVAIHLALSELRRSRWKDVSLSAIAGEDNSTAIDPAAADPGPDAQLEHDSVVDAMRNVIVSELTERQRTVILAELNGMSQEQVADQLGSNRNAVYKLTHDARKKLRAGLEARGYSAADISMLSAG